MGRSVWRLCIANDEEASRALAVQCKYNIVAHKCSKYFVSLQSISLEAFFLSCGVHKLSTLPLYSYLYVPYLVFYEIVFMIV